MTDERNKPDDIVEGFDLPEGEVTPPPESEDAGVAAPAPDQAPVAEGFDLLPDGESAPPPEDVSEAQAEPHVKRAEARETRPPSAAGKFIALIVIPIVAIAAVIWMQMRKQQVEEDYKGAYIKTADGFLKNLDADSVDSIPLAYATLSQDLRAEVDSFAMCEDYRTKRGALGAFKGLDRGRIEWDETKGGVFDSFRALAVFESGRMPVRFWLTGKEQVRITKYTLGTGEMVDADEDEGGEPAYKADYVEQAGLFLEALSSEDTARAHQMLVDAVEKEKTPEALKADFARACGSLGKFEKLVDVTWDRIGTRPTSFRATAVFEKGRTEVWFELTGYFSIEVVKYRFGK